MSVAAAAMSSPRWLVGGMGSMAASCWSVCVKRSAKGEIPFGNGVCSFFYMRRLMELTNSQLVYAAA